MKCRSKYSPNTIFEYNVIDDNNVKIYRDKFSIEISKHMFDEMWEAYDDE